MTTSLEVETHSARASSHPCRLRLFHPGEVPVAAPKLWFAILTYNALAYTKRCLLSLDLHTDEPWHAVILDNTSTDGTREWLASIDDPRVTVALSDNNRGVAGGRNDLLALMLHQVPDDGFVVFVDNDLEFHDGWTAPFRRVFDAAPTAGMASCFGFEVVVHGEHRELLTAPGHCAMPVDVVSGGFACWVKPPVFQRIGGFDETLNPFWHEDDDISVRTRMAGWDVFTVPNRAVVHHGHKSGAALPSLVRGGSLQKQRYLVDKWRSAGIVTPDGRLSFGAQAADFAERVGERLHRTGAIRRSELELATLDIALLGDELLRDGSLAGAERHASAPARAMLAERNGRVAGEHAADASADDSADDSIEARVASGIDTLLAARRRATRLVVRDMTAIPGVSKLADAADWDNGPWHELAADIAGDARGAQQWYDRSLRVWQAAQSAYALEQSGCLTPTSKVLVLGDARAPLVWGLASRVRSVTVADIESHADNPDDLATRLVEPGSVRVIRLDEIMQTLAPQSMSGAMLLPWTAAMSPAELAPLLTAVASRVQLGAPITTCVPVRLAGPPQPGTLDSVASVAKWLGVLGLALLGPLDATMSDVGLLAATDAGSNDRVPDLIRVNGASIVGQLLVCCTHAGSTMAPMASIAGER